MPKPQINRFIVLGDSLSDRRTLAHLWKYGLPMGYLSGLRGQSPEGRFTNGLVWDDALAAKLASELIIREETKKDTYESFPDASIDIADGILARHASQVSRLEEHAYFLNNDMHVGFEGHEDFFRTFAEGGLTAHNYQGQLSSSPSRYITRFLLSTLDAKRNKLFADDAAHRYGPTHKASTLVIEESGINDLITANRAPSFKEVDFLIEARINNIKEMIQHGYRRFMLFNLPDLSKTPLFQKESKAKQKNAYDCIARANDRLEKALADLRSSYPSDDYSFELYDLHGLFDEVYHNPLRHGFDPNKITEPYTQSKDFKKDYTHLHDAHGHLFWDTLHPSGHLHEIAAEQIQETILDRFELTDLSEVPAPDKTLDINEYHLIDAFHLAYQQAFKKDQEQAWLLYQPRSNLTDRDLLSLESLFHHALKDGGTRSKNVMIELGWLNEQEELLLQVPALIKAYQAVHADEALNAPLGQITL